MRIRIKPKTILAVLNVIGVPVTGYLAAKSTYRYEDIRLHNNCKGIERNKKEQFVDVVKGYWPAIVSGTLTIASLIAYYKLGAAELAGMAALAAAGKKKFDTYRQATIDTVGEEIENNICQRAHEIEMEDCTIDGMTSKEVKHTFHIDWLGYDLYFDSTLGEVLSACGEMNRELFDFNTGSGHYKMEKFFEDLHHPELIGSKARRYGYNRDILAMDCDCYWMSFDIAPMRDDPNVLDIYTPWYPNIDIDSDVAKLVAKGVI